MRFWKTDQVQLSSFGMCTIISKFASHHFGNSRQKLRESELITRGAYQKVSGMVFLRLRGQTGTFCVRVPCSDWQTIQWKRASKKCSVGHVFNCCATLIKYNAYFFEMCVNQEVSYKDYGWPSSCCQAFAWTNREFVFKPDKTHTIQCEQMSLMVKPIFIRRLG